jgi:hypothetical protein
MSHSADSQDSIDDDKFNGVNSVANSSNVSISFPKGFKLLTGLESLHNKKDATQHDADAWRSFDVYLREGKYALC